MTSRMIRACSSGVTTGAGEYAPMPPVLGPASPSPSRLWSCDVASGSTCPPPAMTMKLASSPSRNSSTTTTRPASPKAPANMPSGRAYRLVGACGDDHALARGESVRLDDDGRALRLDCGGIEGLAREGGVACRRDAVAHQELLGEPLAALEPGGEPARPEAGQSRGFKGVHDTRDQRTFRTDDREPGRFRARERDESGDIRRGHGRIAAFRLECRAGVARRDDHFGHARGLRELPGQRVLAAAAADDENLHRALNAGSGACR